MVRVSSPAKLRPWSELTAKMVMGVVPGLVSVCVCVCVCVGSMCAWSVCVCVCVCVCGVHGLACPCQAAAEALRLERAESLHQDMTPLVLALCASRRLLDRERQFVHGRFATRFARIDSRESFAIDTPIFIARQADSHESLEFPIRANHPIRANRANRFARITPLRGTPVCS